MIKLRQINSTNASVTRNTPDGTPLVQKEYTLSDIWVNPGAVLYLQEDTTLNAENKKTPLLTGLNREHSFTRLFISENGFARQLSVVGIPATISSMIEDHHGGK